jgi:hypothetical protein
MAIPSRQIGWSTEDNLLWQISKQLEQLTNVTYNACANNAPTYKVFTALLTQSGGDDFQSQSSGAVQKGVTYYVDGGTIGLTDFSNVGGQFQTVDTGNYYFVATIDGTPNEYGGASADYNTGAPVATVLENTIGNIWFTYVNIGDYYVMSDGLFIQNKTFYTVSDNLDLRAPNAQRFSFNYTDINTVQIMVYDPIGDVGQDGNLINTPIEIRVYN